MKTKTEYSIAQLAAISKPSILFLKNYYF